MLDEPDPERQLRLNARNSRAGKLRVGATGEAIRAAAPVDPEIEALWQRIQANYRENQRGIVESLDRKGALSPASTSTAPPTSSGRSTTPRLAAARPRPRLDPRGLRAVVPRAPARSSSAQSRR